MERLEVDEGAPLIPTSVPARILAPYPIRIRPADRTRFPLHARSLSSLTRLERVTKSSETIETRRKRPKRIPFFRTESSSTWSLRTYNGSDLTPPEDLFDKTMKSLRTILASSEDTKKESPKNRLSKRIKDLRGKFDSVGEESHPVAKTAIFDTDSIGSFVMNTRDSEKRPGVETKSTGKMMAALLIGSMQNMCLENIGNADSTSAVFSSNERSNNEAKETCREEEDLHDSEESLLDDIKAEQQQREASSLIDEIEMSSLNDDNSSSNDDLSDISAGYNILDSRCSLDSDDDLNELENPSNFREGISIVRNLSTESWTLEIDSDATNRSSSDVASLEDVGTRYNEIPIITIDVHESTKSDDASGSLHSYDESLSPDVLTSRNSAEIDIVASELIYPSIDKEADDEKRQRSSLDAEEDKRRSSGSTSSESDGSVRSFREVPRRDSCRARIQFAQRDRQLSRRKSSSINETGDQLPNEIRTVTRNDHSVATDRPFYLSRETTDIGVSEEEIRVKATVERRRYMCDLIELIDTKMMVSARAVAHRRKRTVSLRSKRRRCGKKRKIFTTTRNSLEKFPSRGTSTRRQRRLGRDALSRAPHVRSTPDRLSSDRRDPTLPLHATFRSCSSSLVNLTDRSHITQRVSSSSKRAAAAAVVSIDRRSDAFRIPSMLENDRGKAADNVDGGARGKATIDVNHSPSQPSSTVVDTTVVAIRRCSSCNLLSEALCHIDRTKPTNTANMTHHDSCVPRPSPDLRQQDEAPSSVSPSYPLPVVSSPTVRVSQSPATRALANVPLHRRSSDSDLSVTPKGRFPYSRYKIG